VTAGPVNTSIIVYI